MGWGREGHEQRLHRLLGDVEEEERRARPALLLEGGEVVDGAREALDEHRAVRAAHRLLEELNGHLRSA